MTTSCCCCCRSLGDAAYAKCKYDLAKQLLAGTIAGEAQATLTCGGCEVVHVCSPSAESCMTPKHKAMQGQQNGHTTSKAFTVSGVSGA
jgi:hypothetical protein